MNHTELPWRVDDDSARYDHPSHAPRIVSDLKHIAEVCNAEDWGTAGEEWRANAAYIVQACNAYPELVKQLSACLVALESEQMRGAMTMLHVHGMPYSGPVVDMDAIRAALSSLPKET